MELVRRTEPEQLEVGVVPRTSLPAAPGAEEMFGELYLRFQAVGVDHASRFLSRSEARDAVTDALGEVWDVWSKLPPEQRTAAYCLGAIHHQILKRLRENERLVGLDDENAEAQLSRMAFHEIEAPTRADTAADVLDLAVAGMPPRRRQVFLLVRDLRFTYKEVGELLSMSEGTVNTHMRLAKDDLRAAFERHGGFRIAAGGVARLQPGAKQGEANDV